MTTELRRRAPGRPRRTATDAAIIRAAVELMLEGGARSTTLTAVARRAGVARATVYLRWPSRSALIGAAARAAVGGAPITFTGDIERDLRFATRFVKRVFDGPALSAVLPEIVRGVLARPPELDFDSVVPRRREFASAYAAGAAAQGFDPAVDPFLAYDVVLGTAMAHLLANGTPMSAEQAEQLGELVIRGLRRSSDAGVNHEAAGEVRPLRASGAGRAARG
jgi:AcrR family transcriptional regulator